MIAKILHKFNTLKAYVFRPTTYPFLLRLIKTKIFGGSMSLEATKDQASSQCKKRSINTSEAIYNISHQEQYEPIRSKFVDIFQEADIKVAECPQQMGGAGNLDLLYYVTQHLKATRIIETGVAYGWSSLAILLGMKDQPDGQLISTNLHYSRYNNDDSYVGCVVPDSLRKHWTIIREADQSALPKALSLLPECDLCHYDSDKTYAGRMWAYPLLWKSLKIGGCLISDDIGDNLAFLHFCKMLHSQPMIIKMPSSSGEKYVGLLFKQDNHPPKQIMF